MTLSRSAPPGAPPPAAPEARDGRGEGATLWTLSHRADPVAASLADRHYSRQKHGSPQFVPPGRCLVLVTPCARAYWVTSWPFAEYVKHKWAGAWMCSAFRSEGAGVASDLIRSALAATRWRYGEPPPLGLVSFIDRRKVRPVMVRGEPVWGWTWLKAGGRIVGETKGGLLAVQFAPEVIPAAVAPFGTQADLFAGAAA